MSADDDVDDHVRRARKYVARGREVVARQRVLIEKLEADGHDAAGARRLLAAFERSLEVMVDHLALEERLAGHD